MANPYPYDYSKHKRKPLDSFIETLLEGLMKVEASKQQMKMQEDSATKRAAMEQKYQLEKEERQRAEKAKTPEYQLEQERLKWQQGLPADQRQRMYAIDAGLEPKPTAEDPVDAMLRQFLQSQGGGVSAAPQGTAQGQVAPRAVADPTIVNPTVRSLFQKKGIPESAALRMIPKNDEEQSLDEADRELGIVRKDIEAQALEGNKASREKEAEIKNIMQFGLAKTPEEAEQVWGKNKTKAYAENDPMKSKVANALAEREADIAKLTAGGMPRADAEKTVSDKVISDYEKSVPAELPDNVAKGLARIAARGIPIPPAPSVGIGASGLPIRVQFYKEFIGEIEKNGGAADYGLARSDYRTLSSVLSKQVSRQKSMESFVNNIQKQVSRVEEKVAPALSRVDAKLMNKPIRYWQTHVPGSADEAIVSMYAKEISAEIARLSAGSADSIAMLPEGNRAEWEAVHDPELPISEFIRVIKETSHAGQMRLDTVNDVVDSIKGEIGDYTPEKRTPANDGGAYPESGKPKYDGSKMFGVKPSAAAPASKAKGQTAPAPAQPGAPKEGDLFDGIDPTSKQPVKAKFINGKWIRVQ